MRELIEPTLKIMARTGLFLAVVAWVVGQWWEVEAQGFYFGVTATWPGYVIIFDMQNRYPFKVNYSQHPTRIAGPPPLGFTFSEYEKQSSLPGFVYIPQSDNFAGVVTIRHWLIITIFTLINVALWWFYRKPKEVTPCEN